MKNKAFILILFLTLIFIGCYTAVTAFAAPQRWFGSGGLKDNSVSVNSWIKVTVTSADGFAANEEYIAEFIVKQWAESGNYKLVLSGINFYAAADAETLNPGDMWEYYNDGFWRPVTELLNLELIPSVTVESFAAYLKIRVTPDFFNTAGFAKYLNYCLELTAKLVS